MKEIPLWFRPYKITGKSLKKIPFNLYQIVKAIKPSNPHKTPITSQPVVWNHGILWLSHHIGNFIIPTDFHSIIFQRGRSTTNQQQIGIKISETIESRATRLESGSSAGPFCVKFSKAWGICWAGFFQQWWTPVMARDPMKSPICCLWNEIKSPVFVD